MSVDGRINKGGHHAAGEEGGRGYFAKFAYFSLQGRIRVKSRRELGLLTIVSTSSLSSPSTVSSSSLVVPGGTERGGGALPSPLPAHIHTPGTSPGACTSPLPPGSPIPSPVMSPLAVPTGLSYPLKCPYCTYIGTSESVLVRHLHTHGGGLAGVRLYHCNSCPYSATQWESVRRHSWRQHRQEVEAETAKTE